MRKSGTAFIFVSLAAALLVAGCGDFWQSPNGSTSTGTTASTTTLSVSSSTVTAGSSITLTATVTPTAATGTVTFLNNNSSIGTGALSSGTATLSTSFTTAGAASLTASYGGNSTYASSTSSAVSVTVSAAADGKKPATAGAHTSGIHATGVFSSTGGSYTASNSEAAIAEAGSTVTLANTVLSGSAGDGRGVLLRDLSPSAAKTNSDKINFAMTGGSLTYTCDATSTPSCAEGSASKGQNNPATLFSVANVSATVSLAGVKVINNTPTPAGSTGTLLAVQSSASATPARATLTATGTSLTGDAILDERSSASFTILQDDAGTGSSLTGAINSAHRGEGVSLALDKGSMWTVTAASYVTTLSGLDLDGATVNNIDGGGHCVFYSGAVNGSASTTTWRLAGGGYLAPAGTTGLDCE